MHGDNKQIREEDAAFHRLAAPAAPGFLAEIDPDLFIDLVAVVEEQISSRQLKISPKKKGQALLILYERYRAVNNRPDPLTVGEYLKIFDQE